MVFIYPYEVLNYIFQTEGCPMILCLKCGISIAMNEMNNHHYTVHERPQTKIPFREKSNSCLLWGQ